MNRRKVVEPSEILLEEDGTVRTESVVANPWNRFLARMSDYGLFFLALKGLQILDPVHFTFWKISSFIPVEYFLWIPIEALFLWTLGKTPGKWFLRIDLRQGRRRRPDFISALKRSFHVWFRGAGMFIPVINVLCMLVAYSRLKALHMTSWDRDDYFQVTERFIPTWRVVVAALMTLVGVILYSQLRR
jgi:hypothetical protein